MPSSSLSDGIGVEPSANNRARAGEREPTDTKHENRNHYFNESVAFSHSAIL